ncbi:MAG: sulfatase-like hydrolase/transferase [Chitinophagales bacterium]
MKDKLIIFLKKYPLFLYLLPVFFVLHGSMENYDYVPVKDALLLIALYLGFSILFVLLFRLIFKNGVKAAIMAFLIMAFHFFFGSLQDGFRNNFPGSFLSKWVFMLPAIFCLLLLAFIVLKKRKKPLQKQALYLNILFALLIVIDGLLLVTKSINKGETKIELAKEFDYCNNCPGPDVYLIIADEYPGNTELKDLFNYDNSPFLDQLAGRGFHTISNSSSNYNYTPYSIASTLNMDYLDINRKDKQSLLIYTYETTGENKFLKFLKYHQYQFYNYSLSDFKGNPSPAQESFLPLKTRLITSQTLLSRLEKELGFHLVMRSKKAIRKNVYAVKNNNEKLSRLVIQTAETKPKQPKFVLTHLMMPHYPYYYDKEGREFPFERVIEGNQDNQQQFIEYLQYSNKKFLELIDHILKNSSTPPLIILMGDHGFRHFHKPVDPKYYFNNLVSVYLPDKNYSAFTDSLTNVNLLRAVLNTSFGQRLPYLRDTTIIMDNP